MLSIVCNKILLLITWFRTISRQARKLAISTLNQTNIPPKETVVYNKETQTPVVQYSPEPGKLYLQFLSYYLEVLQLLALLAYSKICVLYTV